MDITAEGSRGGTQRVQFLLKGALRLLFDLMNSAQLSILSVRFRYLHLRCKGCWNDIRIHSVLIVIESSKIDRVDSVRPIISKGM
jgi:hypothetical protein